jgi:hypothetical protein
MYRRPASRTRSPFLRTLRGIGVAALLCCSSGVTGVRPCAAQDDTQRSPVSLSVGPARTDAGAGALRYVIELLTRGVSAEDVQLNLRNGFFYFSPDARIEAGEADVLSSLVVRLAGSFAFFHVTEVAGIPTPDTRFFHTLPVALSAETDRSFRNVNVLAEAGYSPWFQGSVPRFVRTLSVGVFAQGGYKFRLEDQVGAPDTVTNGSADQSSEAPAAALFRMKVSARLRPGMVLQFLGGAFGLGLGGQADGWYDIANGDTYYRAEGTMRVKLMAGRFLDFAWQKGSGAPLFNTGEQFSANLTVVF